jgi:hypothetical protein
MGGVFCIAAFDLSDDIQELGGSDFRDGPFAQIREDVVLEPRINAFAVARRHRIDILFQPFPGDNF